MTTPNSSKSPEQIHYENLISFFKWAIGISGSIIAILASVAIFVSYGDRNSMKDEYMKTIENLKIQISEIKQEAKETQQSIKNDLREEVNYSKEYSAKEISNIKIETNNLALAETKKQIDNIFATNKIQYLIEEQAVNEIKKKLPQIINEQTKNDFNINYAATNMRNGIREGEKILKSYYLFPESKDDSIKAKRIYDQICTGYDNAADLYLKDNPCVNYYNNGKLPDDKYTRQGLESVIKELNDPETDLTRSAFLIRCLSTSAKKDFKCFEIDKVNEWYNSLK